MDFIVYYTNISKQNKNIFYKLCIHVHLNYIPISIITYFREL